MTVLALRMAASSNGVSKLHGQVSRADVEGHLAGRAGGRDSHRPRDQRRPLPLLDFLRDEPALRPLPGAAVAGRARRPQAVAAAWNPSRPRSCGARTSAAGSAWWPSRGGACASQLQRRGAPPSEIDAADEVLDPDALTIGFARRFATYKRATLLLRDTDRLERILNQPDRPVQILFAGKAHPARRRRQGADPADRQAGAAERVPPPAGLSGRLRHGGGPLPGAGVGRLAEYAAAATRSQRHQRHEGARQRRAEPEHAGRLVGRSLAGGHGEGQLRRLGHRARRELRQRRIPGPGGSRPRSTTCWNRTSFRRSMTAAPTACRGAGSRT